MARRLYTAWRDEVAQSLYPFAGFGDVVTFDDRKLPEGVLLDALIHPASGAGGYYLSYIELTESGALFEINDQTQALVATGSWSSDQFDASVVSLVDANDDPAGVLVIGGDVLVSLIGEWGTGRHGFSRTTSVFALSTSVVVEKETNDTLVGEGVVVEPQGDLYMVGLEGVRLTCDGNVVTINAVGNPLSKRSECGETYRPPRFITELVFQNGSNTVRCGPGDYGESHMVVGSPTPDFEPALRILNRPGLIQLGLFAP